MPLLVWVQPSNEALLRKRVPGAQDQLGSPVPVARSSSRLLVPSLRNGAAAWRVSNARAFNEGSPRPRVAQTQGDFQSFLSQLHSPNRYRLILLVSIGRSGQAALYCAHRTSTVLSCAFCEQEGHLAAPPSSYYWIAASRHFPFWIRMKVQASPDSVGISSLPSTR